LNKIIPFGEDRETSRHGIYTVDDFSYLFWYRFVFPNKPEIESGYGYDVADKEVFGEAFSAYIGKPPFEIIARQYLIRLNCAGKLPFKATSHGLWWGNDPQAKAQSDFDVVLANRKTKEIILGECKWKKDIKDTADIIKLTGKTHLLADYTDRYYFLFSKASFSDAAKAMANNRLTLVTPEMLFDL
jgi:AAA+ ATPase superfamily predicted ATPase